MSKIKLTGSNSGYVEIDSAADAGNLTLTLPTSGVRLLSNTDNVFSGITTTGELDINGKIDVSTDAVIARNLSVGGITTHTGTTTLSDDVTFTGGSYNVLWDKSDNQLEFGTNAKLSFGASSDLQIHRSGTHSYIKNSSNTLVFNSDAISLTNYAGNSNRIVTAASGEVKLYYSDSVKLETTNTGAIVTGICTATSFSGSGENLTYTSQLSHRNLVINGNMRIAQRATSSGSSGYKTVDRFKMSAGGANAALTQAQVGLSGSTPETEGHLYAYRILNSGQNANTQGYVNIQYSFEAQDIVSSGWNYKSPSSYITLSFWVRVSVAQTYLMNIHTNDGTIKEYNWLISPSVNTWTKITKTIPGNSGITINNDNGNGMTIYWNPYLGSHYTSGSTVDQWVTHSGYTSRPDMGTGWWTTSNSTFQITGVQLEVGQQATPFEHRRYDDHLFACQRYYCELGRRINFDGSAATGDSKYSFIGLQAYTTSNLFGTLANFPRKMRAKPTVTTIGHVKYSNKSGGNIFAPNASTYTAITHETVGTHGIAFSSSLFTQGGFACGFTDNDNANYNYIKADAEL
tara:strand:+ start:1057 stop:2772 length:1716 start_codon:yes stop_codon:yes gene_type:complete